MSDEIFEELAEKYDLSVNRLKVYYEEAKDFEFFDEEKAEEYLENICQKKHVNGEGKIVPLNDYDICDALYRTFGEECLPYLPEKYKHIYHRDETAYEYNPELDSVDLVTKVF